MKGGLVTKKESKNFFFKDFSASVFEPFSSQQLIGAAASFKDLSSRGIQHESLNCVVFSHSSRSGVAGFRAPLVRCALGAENTSNGFCNTSLHKTTSQEEHVFGATVAAGLMTVTDLDVGSQQVPCDTAASAGLRSSFSGNRVDGAPRHFALLSMLEVFVLLEGRVRVRSTKDLLVVLMSMIKRAFAR